MLVLEREFVSVDRRNFEHPQDKQSCGSKNVSVSRDEDTIYTVPKIRPGAGATPGATAGTRRTSGTEQPAAVFQFA